MNDKNQNLWEEISQTWPDPILLKNVQKLLGYPYSRGYTKNMANSKDYDHGLKELLFQIGKFPAIRRKNLVEWLSKRTAQRGDLS